MAELAAAQLRSAEDALAAALPLAGPADAALSAFFRMHRELGARDRSFIAETVFACLRRRRLLEHLAGGMHPRRLVLACLAKLKGVSARELAPFLDPSEIAWLNTVRAADVSELPFALQCDLPDWLIERLLPRLGEAALLTLARSLNEPAPLDLRVNRVKANREAVLARLARDGIVATATPYSPLGVRLAGHPAINRHDLFRSGAIEVQDEGSQLLGLLVAPRRRDLVVDFCAGAGGKTLLLGDVMQSQGRLYAFDTSERRLSKLKPRLARAGLTNVEPRHIADENDVRILRLAAKADRVLVDAPCSGLGTVRRNPDLKWRQSPASVAEMAAKQASIVAAAARLVRPGGRLLYGTCSVLAEENEDVVDAFLKTHPDFALMPAAEVLAQARVALDTGPYLVLTPAAHGCDGFFGAVLERRETTAV
ncbi:MAG TPA: RsmB/NOP family class I SAM-dependent RNA methyltransferase [Burkholderiales bacterium]|nr:RsmB/NOP family class I SAM-dependent RNA methyltransferase [Burkholderiales bacterium]